MAIDATSLQASFITKLSHDIDGQQTKNGNALDTAFEVKYSCSSAIESPKLNQNDYILKFADVTITVLSAARDYGNEYEQRYSSNNISLPTRIVLEQHKLIRVNSEGVKDLLTVVQSLGPQIPGTSWSGRILAVVPTRAGYLARTKIFQKRFTGCSDLGIIYDRTVIGQHVVHSHNQELRAALNSSVLILVRPSNKSYLTDEIAVVEELHARINFQWLLDYKPQQKTLALVHGRKNLEAFLPLYESANALGIKLVVLDRPGHWISEPSKRHLYQDFIPIDMTNDDGFHVRIAKSVKAYGDVDSICSVSDSCLVAVARAAAILGLRTESPDAIACAGNKYETRLIAGGAEPTALVTGLPDLKDRMAMKAFIPQYPLIVKPSIGTGSEHVYKVNTEAELLEGVRRASQASDKQILVEAYIDGPEVDVNFVLLNGELIFFEVADDFPSPGDDGTIDSDFWENTNVLPSKLPDNEYAAVRDKLHQLLLKIGLKTGVFHLEARVQNSSMTYNEKDGLVDLRLRSDISSNEAVRSFLIEINPRPPGFQCVLATRGTYGVDMYDLHLLSSLGDHERLQALAKPFESSTAFPNHARAWSQLVWLRADKAGICATDDACGELLQRLSPDDRGLITESMCFFRRGQRIPEPEPGVVLFGAFFIITSTANRDDILRISRILQQEFSIPVTHYEGHD